MTELPAPERIAVNRLNEFVEARVRIAEHGLQATCSVDVSNCRYQVTTTWTHRGDE
jgi:hypothetical protein